MSIEGLGTAGFFRVPREESGPLADQRMRTDPCADCRLAWPS